MVSSKSPRSKPKGTSSSTAASALYGYSPRRSAVEKFTTSVLAQASNKPLLIIEIDIGESEQEKDRITVYKGDDPKTLAHEFCLKHNLLDGETEAMLELQVQQKIDKVNQSKKEQLLLPEEKVPQPHRPPPKHDQNASLFATKPTSNSYSTRDFAAKHQKTGAQYVEYNESKEATPAPNPAPLAPAASRYREEEDGDNDYDQELNQDL